MWAPENSPENKGLTETFFTETHFRKLHSFPGSPSLDAGDGFERQCYLSLPANCILSFLSVPNPSHGIGDCKGHDITEWKSPPQTLPPSPPKKTPNNNIRPSLTRSIFEAKLGAQKEHCTHTRA